MPDQLRMGGWNFGGAQPYEPSLARSSSCGKE